MYSKRKQYEKEFDAAVKAARERPDVVGALSQLGFDLKPKGFTRQGARRWGTTSRQGHSDDLSSIAFCENPDGTWAIIDNKQRTGRASLDALGFLTDVMHVEFKQAVRLLAGAGAEISPRRSDPTFERREPIEFVFPQTEKTTDDVRDYLTVERCLPLSLVNALIDVGLIRQGSRWIAPEGYTPDVIFEICDLDQKPVGAECCITKKSSSPDALNKKIVPGSNSEYGWRFALNVETVTAETKLFFCEAPIDACSLAALTGEPGIYISLSGLKDITLASMADKLGGTPVLCVDNDQWGARFRDKYPEYASLVPDVGKDWNDELKFRISHGMDYAMKATHDYDRIDNPGSVPAI